MDNSKKICLVTGGTSGMGLETARALAKMGYQTVIVGRNKEKCQAVVNQLVKETSNKNIDYLLADLSSQKHVRQLASNFKKRYKNLHVLVNNAGGFFVKRHESADSIELTFALNHLNYFLLTNLLLDILKKSAPARIVNVSSAEHCRPGTEIDFEDIEMKKGYNPWKAYCQSKLANVLFTYELYRKLKGTDVTVNVLHPGWVKTNIGKNGHWILNLLVPIVQTKAVLPEEGAKTCIYLASSPDVEGVSGKYFDKMAIACSSDQSQCEKTALKLWQLSEKMTN